MAFLIEMVLDRGVDRDEFCNVAVRQNLSIALSRRLNGR